MKYTIDIPENATNGDIMQALFPVKEIIGRLDPAKWLDVLIDGNRYSQFDKTWWNEVWDKGDNMTEEQYKQLIVIPKSKTETEQTERLKNIKHYCMRMYENIRLNDPELTADNVMGMLNHIICLTGD
jgi:hypothetical protein